MISGGKDAGKATPRNHLEIQHFLILSFDFSLLITFISLPQSVLSGERIVNRSAATKRIFLSHPCCKSPRLSQSNLPTHFQNMSAGVIQLSPRNFPFLPIQVPNTSATKFSEFPEPQNSKYSKIPQPVPGVKPER